VRANVRANVRLERAEVCVCCVALDLDWTWIWPPLPPSGSASAARRRLIPAGFARLPQTRRLSRARRDDNT